MCSLWLDDDGEVVFATPGARRWLAGSDWAIPHVGWLGIAREVALRAIARYDSGEPGPVAVRIRVGGGWVAVHAERVTGSDGAPRGVSVVIEPAHPGAILPLAVAAYGLTDREAQVAREVLKGSDTRTVSRTLRISEYTVQDHLKSMFSKVGVHSRGELAYTLALSLVRAPAGAAPRFLGWSPARRLADHVSMADTATPLEVYRRFQAMLIDGEYGRLGEVVDVDGYTENCVGLTGWTTGLQVALRNFQQNIASALTDMRMSEQDIVESGDTLVIRSRVEAAHTGQFLGRAPTGRRVSYDAVDMYKVRDGRIVWRFLLCDWKGLLDQISNV